VSRLFSSVKRWPSDVWNGWSRFWFTPTDPATLSLIRLLGGSMLFYTHLVWSLELEAFFGPNSWISHDGAGGLRDAGSYAWSYFWWIDSPTVLWAAHIAALIVFAMLALGLFTRVVSVLAFIATLSYAGRVPGALFGLDQINLLLAMYLMLGPSGAYYSLDRFLRRRRLGGAADVPAPSVSANIAIRLIQLHMCIIYLFAGMSKLTGETWWNGTAMWLAMANLEYQSLDMTWLSRWPRLINFMTHLTVFWELYYCALIWPRRLRPIMLLLAVPLHLGIALCLGMVTFGLVMLIANLAFVPPWVVHAVLDWRAGQGRGDQVLDSAQPAERDMSRNQSRPALSKRKTRR